ncbi:MAG: transposase, partial [Thiobacillus sp.]
VWVLTNMTEVAYVLAESREAEIVHVLLKDFKGVLVSDFYAAYESIPCPQQKCLIHLAYSAEREHPFCSNVNT